MAHVRFKIGTGCALAALFVLFLTPGVLAQGIVTPSFGDGHLALIGEAYRPGERVELTVRVGDAAHQFAVTANACGRFHLDTGLAVPPLSSLEIEARDEQEQTQVTITSVPSGPPGLPVGEEESLDGQPTVESTATDCAP